MGAVGAPYDEIAHTDMPDYPAVVREVTRALRPGGVFVHIGVHPAFCGGFADRSDPEAGGHPSGLSGRSLDQVVWTTQGVRHRVGASRFPLPALLSSFMEAGLTLTGFAEGGGPVPVTLSVRAVSS